MKSIFLLTFTSADCEPYRWVFTTKEKATGFVMLSRTFAFATKEFTSLVKTGRGEFTLDNTGIVDGDTYDGILELDEILITD